MKIILEEEDLRSLETTLMRAMVRAARIILREMRPEQRAASAGPAPEKVEDVVPPSPQVDLPGSLRPYRPDWAKPYQGEPSRPTMLDRVRETQATGPAVEQTRDDHAPVPRRSTLPIAPRPTFEKRHRRSMAEICKTMKDRPSGFVPTDEVYPLIDTTTPSQTLSGWITKGEIPAVIVASYRPPTKGLPGRLMVDKKAIIEREALRKRNSGLSPIERQPVPRAEFSPE